MPKHGSFPLSAASENDAKRLAKLALERRDRMLKKLGPTSGKTLRARKRGIRQVLKDRHCIFAALVEVARKKGGYETPILPLVAKSHQIDMWAKCAEPVWLVRTENYSAKERWICPLGLIEATRN